jgi:hypothetical protein
MCKMTSRKVYSYDDLDNFCKKYIKFIIENLDELNKNIIHPTEDEYKKFWYNILEKTTDVKRCLATYTSGKHKGQRCQASQSADSKYCLNHLSQGLKSKQSSEADLTDSIISELLSKAEQIIDLINKSKQQK